MRRQTVLQWLLAASVAASVPVASAQAEPPQSAEVAALIGNGSFEFRGRYTMWKFTADGRVTADDSQINRLAQGGSGEQFGMKSTGTWRRAGERLYITWEGKAETSYTITPGQGRMVKLVGDKTIEGTLEASGPAPSFAESPAKVAPGVTYP